MKQKTPLLINEPRQEVFVQGRKVKLTPTEYRILVVLKKSGETKSREDLTNCLANRPSAMTLGETSRLRTVDQHIARLRKKIKIPIISTVTTYGYRYDG